MPASARLVWTDEADDGGKTLLFVDDLYLSKEAFDTEATGAMPETLGQLEGLLSTFGSSTETK